MENGGEAGYIDTRKQTVSAIRVLRLIIRGAR